MAPLLLRLQRVERTALSMVLSGRAGIRPMMALRIEHWLGDERGGSAEPRLSQQLACDLLQARRAAKRANEPSKVRPAG